jgi:hypothetical protein
MTYEGTYRSYEKIVDNWTRSQTLYHNFSTNAQVSATFFSLPMRRAFVSEWGRAYDLPVSEREVLLDENLARAKRSVEFVLSFYTPKESYNDLISPNSSWRLWLIDADGRKVGAAKVERMRVKHRKEYYFFPYYNDWSRLYRAVFPAIDDNDKPLKLSGGKVTLRVAGVEGSMNLVWDVPANVY